MQDIFLFSNTIEANIAYYNPDASPEQVHACGKAAEVDEFANKLPDKYDTIVGEKGFGLSGGQKGKTISTSGRFPSVLCHAPDLSSFALHVLAMLLMLCDHLWATLLPQYAMLTHIGRIAFPIFAFLLAEGARHTHDPKNICSAC